MSIIGWQEMRDLAAMRQQEMRAEAAASRMRREGRRARRAAALEHPVAVARPIPATADAAAGQPRPQTA